MRFVFAAIIGAGCVSNAPQEGPAAAALDDELPTCAIRASEADDAATPLWGESEEGGDVDAPLLDFWALDNAPAEVWAEVTGSGPLTGYDDGLTNPRVVVIPYGTTDFPVNPLVTSEVIRQEVFAGTRSLNGFFDEVSYGKFQLEEGYVDAPMFVDMNWQAWGALGVNEQFRVLASQSAAPWSTFDVDSDGLIERNEAIVVLMDFTGGQGGAKRDPASITVKSNGKPYTVQVSTVYFPAKRNGVANGGVDPIVSNLPAITHEFGHAVLQLPDVYGLNPNPTGPYEPMNCCVYGQRLMHFTAVEKIKAGFSIPVVHVADGTTQVVSLRPSETNDEILVWVHPKSPQEYWVFENRQKSTSVYERGFPESGLAVWRVKIDDWGAYDRVQLLDRDTYANPAMAVTPMAPSLFDASTTGTYVFPDSSGEPRVTLSNVWMQGDRVQFKLQ